MGHLLRGRRAPLARLGAIAAFEVRELFDADSKLLPVADWPDTVRSCIRGIQTNGGGHARIAAAGAAHRAGDCRQVRSVGDSLEALADAIRANKARRPNPP